eukprot:scaffold601_cov496-Prasinococcus_capsulatus_cf.AAC.6
MAHLASEDARPHCRVLLTWGLVGDWKLGRTAEDEQVDEEHGDYAHVKQEPEERRAHRARRRMSQLLLLLLNGNRHLLVGCLTQQQGFQLSARWMLRQALPVGMGPALALGWLQVLLQDMAVAIAGIFLLLALLYSSGRIAVGVVVRVHRDLKRPTAWLYSWITSEACKVRICAVITAPSASSRSSCAA